MAHKLTFPQKISQRSFRFPSGRRAFKGRMVLFSARKVSILKLWDVGLDMLTGLKRPALRVSPASQWDRAHGG